MAKCLENAGASAHRIAADVTAMATSPADAFALKDAQHGGIAGASR